MTHLLAIAGSPRQGSNSATLGRVCLEAAAAEGCETRLLDLADLTVGPCLACGECFDYPAGERGVQDDDMPTVLEAMLWAEGMVFATPKHSSHTLQGRSAAACCMQVATPWGGELGGGRKGRHPARPFPGSRRLPPVPSSGSVCEMGR